jgi:hypothetical protein
MPSGSHFSRRDLFSLTSFGTFAGVAALARPVTGESAEVEALSAPGPDREKTGVLYETASGPWGDLTYYYFYLEAPMHLIDAFPVRTLKTRWAVPLQYEAEFRAVLEALPLSSAQRGALFAPDNLGLASGLYALFPPSMVVETLSPEARGILYNYLGRFGANEDIQNPVRIRSGSVEEWTKGTSIRPDLIEKMKTMVYFRGDLLVFADFSHLISLARSEAEARQLQKHSSRVRSMAVQLRLKDSSRIEEIIPYWTTGLGLRRKEVEPLMQASAETPGVGSLDLVHMLPPLARKLVYTYPDMSMASEGVLPDCHWTALNFFNYDPEPIYLDEFFAASRLLAGFEQVEAPYRFGDVLVFLTEEMNAHHSCIYLAADLVYTKNGRSLYAPWTILNIKDVQSTYPDYAGKPLRVQGFRRLPT